MMPLEAKLTPLVDMSALEAEWRKLEGRADRSFFLSWTWIGSWLESFTDRPTLIEVRDSNSRIIGLGIFCEARETRKKIIRSRQLRLHETGDPSQDVITIEYNTLLAERGMEQAVWFAAMTALRGKDVPYWDELIIGGASETDEALLSQFGLSVHKRAEATSAYVDLAALRADGVTDAEGYVASLGKSTRSQIRRSMKLYRARGEFALDVAASLDEAKTFLAELSPHHEAKWNAIGQRGATQNEDYIRFHTRMMERAYGSNDGNGVEFLRARAGDHAFGWLYNFVDRGKVLFYLSGFAFEDDNKLKPGLVTHALAIEHHLKAGMDVYDFMGGDNRYKFNLGQKGADTVSYALQRKTLPMLVESVARSLKAKLGSQNGG